MSSQPTPSVRDRLARSHGYLAVARDGICGSVETPLFPPAGGEPDFLIVRLSGREGARLPVAPVELVSWVDPERELVYLDATRREVDALAEHPPVAR